MKSAIKQLFLVPPLAMIIVMVIALIRPAAIFGGIHYGGILGIYIPVNIIMIIVVIIYYRTATFFPDTSDSDGIKEIVMFAVTMVCYALSIISMTTCVATLPQRDVYICTPHEFGVISNLPGDSTNFYLENDIDFNGQEVGWFGKLQIYKGEFSGNGFTIKNLKVKTVKSSARGLGLVGSNYGKICNLNFESCIFNIDSNSSNYLGVIAGTNYGEIANCRVANCQIEWSSGSWDDDILGVGGIAGRNAGGKISNTEFINEKTDAEHTIYANANFNAAGFGTCALTAGGVVGYLDGGTLENCVVYGADIYTDVKFQAGFMSINPYQTTGGLIGNMMGDATVNMCISIAECGASKAYITYLSGEIVPNNDIKYEGIFVARTVSGTFSNCYSGTGGSWIVGNNSNGANGIAKLNRNDFSVEDLSNDFASWRVREDGKPIPSVEVEYDHLSSRFGIWIVLGLLGAIFIGVGIYNYVFIAFKKGREL